MKTDAQKYCDKFEELSTDIIREIFHGEDAEIEPTRPKKDGGYDTIVTMFEHGVKKRIYFEHKLRSENLNLRDISANTIIAYNEGAASLVIMTNLDYTYQAQDNLEKFARKAILNIKIFIGEDIKKFCIEHNIPIQPEIDALLRPNRTLGKNKYDLLKLNLSEASILSQIVSRMADNSTERKPFVVSEFEEKYKILCDHLLHKETLRLYGCAGVGKKTMIKWFSTENNYCLISLNAPAYDTTRKCLSEILMELWGVGMLDGLLPEQVENICTSARNYSGDGIENILRYLLTSDYKNINPDSFNLFICRYIVESIKGHGFNYLFFLSNVEKASHEVQVLLNYLCSLLKKNEIPCVIKEDVDTSELLSADYGLEIPQLDNAGAERFIKYTDPSIPTDICKMIIRQLGMNIFVLNGFMRMRDSSEAYSKLLERIPVGTLPEMVSFSLAKILKETPSVIYALILCHYSIPYSLITVLSEGDIKSWDRLVAIGLLSDDGSYLTLSGTLIQNNVSHLITTGHRIQMRRYAANLIQKNETEFILHPEIYAELLRYSGNEAAAYKLISKLCDAAKEERQYSSFISLAEELLTFHISNEEKASFLIDILQICVIRRRTYLIEKYLNELYGVVDSMPKSMQMNYQSTINYFQAKIDFRMGKFTQCFENTKYAYDLSLTAASNEWDHYVAWMHILCIKETQGYSAALNAYEKIRKECPDDRVIKKGYLSHVACMSFSDKPQNAIRIYKRMINEWERSPQNIYELPFHEYVDLAMSYTCARQLDDAWSECEKAIDITRSNGVFSELARAYNIRGCLWLLKDNLKKAEDDFRDSIALFAEGRSDLYDYRAKLNLASLCEAESKEGRKLLDQCFQYYMKNCVSQVSGFRINDGEIRVYLALLKILRTAEKHNCSNIINSLTQNPDLQNIKKQFTKDWHAVLSEGSFVYNNEILLMA